MFSLFKRHKSTPSGDARTDAKGRISDDLAQQLGGLSLGHGREAPAKLQTPRHERPFVGGFVSQTHRPTHSAPSAAPANRHELPPPPSAPVLPKSTRPDRPAPPHQFPIPSTYGAAPPGPLPVPPARIAMPVPAHEARQDISQTMRYALGTPTRTPPRSGTSLRPPIAATPVRPHSDPELPPSSLAGPATPSAAPARPHSSSVIQTPASTSRKPAATPLQRDTSNDSSPPSPSSTSATGPPPDSVRCSAITQKGVRCSRKVQVGPALTRLDSTAEVIRFCHQHVKQVLEPTGFYLENKLTKTKQWIDYQPWIAEYLQPDTKAALREEMRKPRSEADELGFIYTFEIREPNNTKEIHLKVGRTVKLNKRLDEWSKQCGSKEQVLRGWWPGTVEADNGSHLRGRVLPGDPGLWCHRVERLVHLELADLALNAPYLEPEFPNVPAEGRDSTSPARPRRKPCSDCGAMHKEIFSFPRPESGRYKDQVWELIVQPVIDKWGGFVAGYMQEPLPTA
ncbi:hypothetical protein CERSUDRAFT_117298 [Gelatoporia subvermispora B]|uniref:DUF1766-domain-containing protein n=1 Tax=Ceriporiopsis subvermispora (strain B) TaxID=914234 RepID=M2R7Q4_CERS8|nr:hypothetical protein CERSUDRAFT_117298 [Gelatoporia subvermispora B]